MQAETFQERTKTKTKTKTETKINKSGDRRDLASAINLLQELASFLF